MSRIKRGMLLVLVFVMLAGFPAQGAFSGIIEPERNTLGMNYTHLSWGDEDFRPLYGVKLHLVSDSNIALGGDFYYREDHLQFYNIFLQYQLEDPLWGDNWTSLQLGYSDLFDRVEGERRGGLMGGIIFTRPFNENWEAHTAGQLYAYRGHFDIGYETGFQYYGWENMSLELTYRGYPLGNRGPNLGLNLHF